MNQTFDIQAVRRLAPEDVRVDAYVIPMTEVVELLPFCPSPGDATTVRRLEITATDGVRVLRVMGVFLPYVFVRDALGDHDTLDLRVVRLGEVPKDLARFVRKRLRADKRRAIKREKSD